MEKAGNDGDKQKLKYQFQKYPEKKKKRKEMHPHSFSAESMASVGTLKKSASTQNLCMRCDVMGPPQSKCV